MSGRSNELHLESRVESGPDVYRFRTVDGVVSPGVFRTAELALAEACWERVSGRVLCPEANYGVVGTILGDRAESVTMTESSARAARLCRHNAAENGVGASVTVTADLTTISDRFETVVYAPKPYTPLAIASRHIATALEVLEPGGQLFVSASKRNGLNRYETVLEEYCSVVECIDRTEDIQVLRAVRPADCHSDRHVTPDVLRPTVDGVNLEVVTLPGTFAASELDRGTRVLIESAGRSLPEDGRILDLCCGCGPIGAYAAATTDGDVWLSDDCRFATRCAERTLERTGVDGTVVTADCLRGVAGRTFDAVVCNPPTHAGTGVLSTLFADVADVVASDGHFWFVHHRSLDLSAHTRRFDRVERVATGDEHVVFRAIH